MSLLLDALKEAEARKRDAAPAVAIATSPAPANAPATAIGSPTATEATFDNLGALALAEDVHPEPVASPAATATPLRAAPTPAETLLAARAARTNAGVVRGPAVGVSASTPASTMAPATPPAARPNARAAAGHAAVSVATPARPRGLLPWLVGLAGLLALLVGGAFLYDAIANRMPQPAATAGRAATAVGASPVALAEPSTSTPGSETSGPGDSIAGPFAATTQDPATRPAAFEARTALPRPGAGVGRPAAPPPRGTDAANAANAAQDARLADANTRDPRISISRQPAPLDAAWAAQQAGDLDRAEALYRRVLDSEHGQVDAQLGLAVIAHSRGNDAAARHGYRQVLESVPDHPRAWAGLAELAGEDDAGGIESRLRQLLANRPSAPLHFALGNVLARQERWSDAQQEYFAAATLAPDAPDYAYNVAVALERIGKPAAAMPWYAQALQQAAGGRAVRFDRAATQARLEQLRAAPP